MMLMSPLGCRLTVLVIARVRLNDVDVAIGLWADGVGVAVRLWTSGVDVVEWLVDDVDVAVEL